MKQKELILTYVKNNGSIIPAKMGGKIYCMTMFGSETPKRCRELRQEGKLISQPCKDNPKFEEFSLPGQTSLI